MSDRKAVIKNADMAEDMQQVGGGAGVVVGVCVSSLW